MQAEQITAGVATADAEASDEMRALALLGLRAFEIALRQHRTLQTQQARVAQLCERLGLPTDQAALAGRQPVPAVARVRTLMETRAWNEADAAAGPRREAATTLLDALAHGQLACASVAVETALCELLAMALAGSSQPSTEIRP